MNTTEQELKEILDYQIEKIIRQGTTYEFEIIDSPFIIIDGGSFSANTNTVYGIREHQLTSKFNSIREEFIIRYEYEMVDFILTAIEFILSFLEEHKGKRIFIMGESFNSGPTELFNLEPSDINGTFVRNKTIRAILI
jgi:hypothetical protein